ncbi:hypothetical protein J2785_007391 [Burkholderia ambifaria]|nr:hypothetical protein [Burkholderia ambifaria]
MIRFDVADHRFEHQSTLQPLSLPCAQRLVLAAMDQLHGGDFGIHAAHQSGEHGGWLRII